MVECRMIGCTEEADGKFCSMFCEVKFEHLEEDAKEARLDEEEVEAEWYRGI